MKHDFEIITERLSLRAPELHHAEEINAAMNAVWDNLQLWMSWAHHGENTIEKTRNYIAGEQHTDNIPLVAFSRESGKFVLSTGLMKKEDGVYKTGYWVAKEFLGKGLATEATAATIRHAFESLEAKRILINHYDGNEASRRIIEKLGFIKTGYAAKSHARCSDGALLGTHHYEIDQRQWRQRCP